MDYRKTLRTTYGTQGLRIQRVKIHENSNTKAARWGNSLVVWWLGPGAFTAMAQIQSLARELRSLKVQV